MRTMQRWLLALLACVYSTPPAAQIDVDVEIRGVSSELEQNVRLFLSIEQQKQNSLMTEGRLYRLHEKAPQEIRNALKPYGYYRPRIDSRLTRSADEHWQAVYSIDAGPPLPVGTLKLTLSGEMKQDPEFQTLIEAVSLQKGSTFNHLQYKDIKSNLARLAAERGYFEARFEEHRVEIDLDVYEARINLHYDGGPRYHFGEVSLEQDVLDPELLRRYLTFERGDPYTLSALIDLQRALNDSDYFHTVEVSPGETRPQTGEIPVEVSLTPRKVHRYTLGLGYGTDTGARAKFGWEIPRLNQHGHKVNTELKVAEIGYSLSAHYRVPVFNPRTDQLVYSIGEEKEETDTSESTIRTVGVSLNRSRGDWRESVALNYQQEDFEVGDERGDSTLLMPSVSWSRTWGSNFIHTLDGLRFDIGLRGARDNLVSDTSFTQLQGGLKGITSLGADNRLILRGRFGTIRTDAFNQLPSSVRFFAGGAQSVRGYAFESLGPVDADGDVVGGKHLMIGSIEFEHSLNGKWGLALFYDAGNAINDLADKLERGAGFGLRWQSPIGPVRIDLASAISRDGQPWRLHVTIGPDL